MELTTSKSLMTGFAAAILLAAALPVEAQANGDDDWLHQNGFGFGEGYYTTLADFTGGGAAAGGEYVNSAVPWGSGGKLSFSMLFHDYNEPGRDCFASDMFLGADIFLLARAMDVVTIYGGCGVDIHTLDYTYDHTDESYEGGGATSNVFAGIRWVFAGHCYVFAEYRREFGDIEVEGSHYSTRSRSRVTTRQKIDLSDNRVVIGIGGLF